MSAKLVEYNHECNHCGADCSELVQHEGFRQTYFVEWVCHDCFKELVGCSFEDYDEAAHYGREHSKKPQAEDN